MFRLVTIAWDIHYISYIDKENGLDWRPLRFKDKRRAKYVLRFLNGGLN